MKWMEKCISSIKKIREIEFIDEIPKTSSSPLLKASLKFLLIR